MRLTRIVLLIFASSLIGFSCSSKKAHRGLSTRYDFGFAISKNDVKKLTKITEDPWVLDTVFGEDKESGLHHAVRFKSLDALRLLLKRKIHPNILDGRGRTPLHTAIQTRGGVDMVRALVEAGADPSIKDRNGKDVYSYAFSSRDTTVRNYLRRSKNSTPNQVVNNTPRASVSTPRAKPKPKPKLSLFQAVQQNNFTRVSELLEGGGNPNKQLSDGRTALHLAAGTNTDMVGLLLKHDADINIRDKRGRAPLHVACEMGSKKLTEYFLQRGAKQDAVDSTGRSALHIAASRMDESLVELLLDWEVDHNLRDKKNRSAKDLVLDLRKKMQGFSKRKDREKASRIASLLNVESRWQSDLKEAIRQKDEETFKELINDGRFVKSYLSRHRDQMISFAVVNNVSFALNQLVEKGQPLSDEQVLKFLAAAIDGRTESLNLAFGLRPIQFFQTKGIPILVDKIVSRGSRFKLEKILKLGIDSNTPLQNGDSLLHVASKSGDWDNPRVLISHGAKINKPGAKGWTPFHYAVASGGGALVAFMLEEGATISLEPPGKSITELAVSGRSDEVLDLVMKKGAQVPPGHKLLDIAVTNGDITIIKMLLKAGQVPSNTGRTTLIRCMDEGPARWRDEILELLLEAGAKVNIASTTVKLDSRDNPPDGYTALDIAERRGNKKEVEILRKRWAFSVIDFQDALNKGQRSKVETLLKDRPGIVHHRDPEGRTALHAAARSNKVELVKIVFPLVSTAIAVDDKGNSPLHDAAEVGSKEIVLFLLKNGADVNWANKFMNTPLHIAIMSSQYDAADTLLAYGADFWKENYQKRTAIQIASIRGDEKLKSLLEKAKNITYRLLLASGNGDTAYLKKTLDQLPRFIHARNKSLKTLLHIASEEGQKAAAELLIARGAQVNAKASDGATPLHWAVLENHPEVVSLLLKNKAQVDAALDNDRTPLHMARSVECARLLIEQGAPLDVIDSNRHTPLHGAAVDNLPDIIELLVKSGANPNIGNKHGYKPIHLAAWKDREEAIRALHRVGANLNAKSNKGFNAMALALSQKKPKAVAVLAELGQTVIATSSEEALPALLAASASGELNIVKKLIAQGEDLQAVSEKTGANALFYAIGKGHVDVLKVLVKAGVKVNLMIKSKNTPLVMATTRGRLKMVEILLDGGADPNLAVDGWTPLHYAVSNSQPEIVKLLIKRKADYTKSSPGGTTPLALAIESNQLGMITTLWLAGVNVNEIDRNGETLLHKAAGNGQLEIARRLLGSGAKVDYTDNKGRTPLHHAAIGGHLEVIKLLLDRGAVMTKKDRRGNTPSMLTKDSELRLWFFRNLGTYRR